MAFRVVRSTIFARPLPVLAFAAVSMAMAGAIGQPTKFTEPQLILLDGSSVQVRSLEINGGKLRGEGVPPDLTLDDLRRIELPGDAAATSAKPSAVVDLRGGGRVFAKSVAIGSEKFRLEWTG